MCENTSHVPSTEVADLTARIETLEVLNKSLSSDIDRLTRLKLDLKHWLQSMLEDGTITVDSNEYWDSVFTALEIPMVKTVWVTVQAEWSGQVELPIGKEIDSSDFDVTDGIDYEVWVNDGENGHRLTQDDVRVEVSE